MQILKGTVMTKKEMMKEIFLKDRKIQYTLEYKNVKNINLRIKPDTGVHVSANRRISEEAVEEFMLSKSDFILRALDKYASLPQKPLTQYFREDEITDFIIKACERVYPYFKEQGIAYPQIKFRKMVSQWGNCRSDKGILTFNTNLMFAPPRCIEYVVLHEFTHFIEANHSKKFYAQLEKVCPNWKLYKKMLSEIHLRK